MLRDWALNIIYIILLVFFGEGYSGKFPKVNGVAASKAQLELARNLRAKDRHINYKACGYYIDIALPRRKIAIEYNGKFWHQHKKRKDQRRVNQLNRCGWKVLSILTDDIPPAEQVWLWIEQLERSRKKYLNVEY